MESLLPTLVSRSQRIPFYRLSQADVVQVLTQTGHADILAQPQILDLAQGSPGDAVEQWTKLQEIPAELLTQVIRKPMTIPDALRLAKQIAKTLDIESQIWLIDYLQQIWWKSATASLALLHQLEQAKAYLKAFVQPQLVWEVTLMTGLE